MTLLIFILQILLIILSNSKQNSYKNKTQIFCNNNFNIVSSEYECITPGNNCGKEKPFNCSVNGIMSCVKSQTDCDCPKGYYKCNYMKYCVPEDRIDMCPKYHYRNCNELNNNWEYYNDGICRNKNYIQPSQRVCPIDKILCPDLSCEDNYNNCKIYDILSDGKTRCVDQNITQYAYECQSTITCSDLDKVVCPDGKCVKNEIFCKSIKECPIDTPFLCKYNNKCVTSLKFCEKYKYYCGDGLSLCEDYVCREYCGNIDYDNSPYIIENCILSPKNSSFIAGNYINFTLELRTEKGLLYNGNIDINNDILIEILKYDESFSYSINKLGTNNGIYIITIYSHVKGNNTMKVFLNDLKPEKREVGLVEYLVHPGKVPCKNYTFINNEKKFNVKANTIFEISFTLSDNYNNSFEGRNDIIDNNYLLLLNGGEPMSSVSMSMINENTYKFIIYAKYPPKTMYLNILYNDTKNSVYCFMEDIIVNIIITDIDFYRTQIISNNKERIYVGEYLDMKLYIFDKKGECFDDKTDYSDKFKIVVTGPLNSNKQSKIIYVVKKISGVMEEECNNEYQIIIIEEEKYKYAGNYIIKVYGNDELIAQYNQVCIAKDYVLFFLDYEFDPNHISVYETTRFTITGTDEYLNKIENFPLIDDITIDLSLNGVMVNKEEYEKEKYEIILGELHYNLDVHKAGKYQLHMYYKENEVKVVNIDLPLPILNFFPGPCYAENNTNFNLSTIDGFVTEKPVSFKFQCYDKYYNKIIKGGEDFSVTGHILIDNDNINLNNVEINDNTDGTYSISFIPNYPGKYIISIFNKNEKYGEDVSLLFEIKECKGSTPILCPDDRCVENYYQCIEPPNGCDIDTPFKCKVNGIETCVKSQIDCDCPLGYIRCGYMHYCVKEGKNDMCPTFKATAKCKISKNIVFPDGVCRPSDHLPPNQIVCPIGYVLCPDLTCRKNHSQCELSPDLPSNKVRCVDQSIKNSNSECPSTISCDDPNQVVCSNTRKCVNNEIECPKLTECSSSMPFLCSPDWCVPNSSYCPKAKACGEGYSMCSDLLCKTSCSG